jgi:hypothetical protein
MSYFVCGYNTNSTEIEPLCRFLLDAVPVDKHKSSLRLGGTCSHVISYGTEKVIPDVAIEEENGDSWLAMLGTPLMRFTDKQSEQEFLDGFLASPGEFLRHKIDGNFALFCYDSKRNRFLAATDFNNTIPIFYTVRPNGIFFSSHELVLAKSVNAEIDPHGFAQAIHLGATWGSRTRFRDVFKMFPCEMVVIDAGRQTVTKRYWRPEEETVLSCSFDELVSHWLSSLGDSIRKYYECSDYGPMASDLTGGEDARLLVAQCHALGIPFKAQVAGSNDNSDVIVAKQAAMKTGIDLIVRERLWIKREELLANALTIILQKDAHQEFIDACIEWATNRENPLDNYKNVVLCGVPGGVAFRGQYYLKGKAIFPSKRSNLDYKFFTRLKFLLDYYPGLLAYPDDKFRQSVYGMIRESLMEIEGFPIGTQIDHLLRVFGTCLFGLKYKVPLYLPSAVRDLTRSVYYIPPHYKAGGRLTRACTEILFPELAFVKTQKGVPTVRMTAMRFPLFIPEYIHLIKSIRSGVVSRLFKWKQPKRASLNMEKNAYIFTTILSKEPYCDWFSSSKSMVTGQMYNADEVNSFLSQAKAGSCRNVPILGRIINLELACRWVYGKGL